MISEGDEFKVQFNHKLASRVKTYDCSYLLPFLMTVKLPALFRATPLTFIDQNPCNLALMYQYDTSSKKHASYEKSFIAEVDFVETPWRLKFEQSLRNNAIDAFASK